MWILVTHIVWGASLKSKLIWRRNLSNDIKVKVNASVQVLHKDFEVVVRNDEGKLGTLLISKGNIEWLPKGNSVNKRRLSWKNFAAFMETDGKLVKAKK